MRFGVLGGGFGLYGWLSAAAHVPGARSATLQRYRPVIEKRPDLAHLADQIQFVDGLDALLGQVDAVIVARRPQDQLEVVDDLVTRGWRGSLILEKPFAPDPTLAAGLLAALEKADIRLLPGFAMHRTGWGSELGRYLAAGKPVSVEIEWNFLAYHYRHSLWNWKRLVASGGGALRFFSIHFIGWLSRYGAWEVEACSPLASDGEDPAVAFSMTNGPARVSVRCNSRWSGDAEFSIRARLGDTFLNKTLSSPFDEGTDPASGEDQRIPYLLAILQELAATGGELPSQFQSHIALWRAIEARRGLIETAVGR